MTDEFYKEKAWDLLLKEIKEIKDAQTKQGGDIEAIKNKMTYIFGAAAGITFVVNIAWQWIKNKIQS